MDTLPLVYNVVNFHNLDLDYEIMYTNLKIYLLHNFLYENYQLDQQITELKLMPDIFQRMQ